MIGMNRLVLMTAATGLVSMLVFCGNGSPEGSDPLLLNLTQTLDREHYHAPDLDDEFLNMPIALFWTIWTATSSSLRLKTSKS